MSRIILLEPDRILAEVYRQMLTVEGHDVIPCASAQAAIMAADDAKPDLIILELQLIEHSGIEFLYEFRSYPDWARVPVLIQSHVPAGEFAANWQLLKSEQRESDPDSRHHPQAHQLWRGRPHYHGADA
jgi:CheY-like chemotaxis protein